MLNEYAYCPRLFHLMHVEGRWADNAYTVEGRNVHSRVDKIDHVLPDPEAVEAERPLGESEDDQADESVAAKGGDEPPTVTQSVNIGSDVLGLTGSRRVRQYSRIFASLRARPH
jgi:CRISPR-associated protein Cas1